VAQSQRSRRARSWGVGLLVYAGAGVAVWTYFATSGNRLPSVHADVSLATANIDKARGELKDVQARLTLAKREAEARQEVHDHPDLSILLRRLAEAAGPDITFERIDLRPVSKQVEKGPKPDLAAPWGYTLTITGIAGTQGEVPRFAHSLEKMGLFEAVSVLSIKAREAPIIEREDGSKWQSPLLFSFEVTSTLSDQGAAGRAEGAP
jgi:hypothetical protein